MSDEEQRERPKVDEAYAFDPTDPEQAKDFDRMSRIRSEQPICRPAENLVLTTRYPDTATGFRDAKRYSSVGDMRAPGVVVPEEESFLGELDSPLHPKIRRILIKGFTRRRAAEAEPWTRAEVKRRLAGIAAREMDGTCRTNQPCPDASAIEARDALVDLLGGPRGTISTGHVVVRGPRLTCRSEGSAGGNRTAAWCRLPSGADLSCSMIQTRTVLRWDRYWKGPACR